MNIQDILVIGKRSLFSFGWQAVCAMEGTPQDKILIRS